MIVFAVEMTLKNGSNLLYLLVICIASKSIKFNDLVFDLLRQNLNQHQDMEVERTICEGGIGVAERCCKVFRRVQDVTTQFYI